LLIYIYNLVIVGQVKLFKLYQQHLKSKQMNTQHRSQVAQHFIDITNEICPMTFVKTKLMIEKMLQNDILEVRLKGKEPLLNVPRSVLEYGHIILYLEPESDDQGPLGSHRLLIRKV
jgi:TusA-related sulfurtransferase